MINTNFKELNFSAAFDLYDSVASDRDFLEIVGLVESDADDVDILDQMVAEYLAIDDDADQAGVRWWESAKSTALIYSDPDAVLGYLLHKINS